jgi:hypothetical protein
LQQLSRNRNPAGLGFSGIGQFEYRIRVRLRDGRALGVTRFLTPRRRAVGDLVELPVRPDGELQPGEQYEWRVAAVEEDGTLLVLEFDRAA